MRAAVYERPRAVGVHDVARPEPGPHDVLVRIRACGICGTDQHIFHGDFFPTYPLIGGHEMAGEVEAIGSEVDTVVPGTRVAVDPSVFCGHCFFCQRQQGNHCLNWNAIGVTRDGGVAEYVVAPKANVYPIGDMAYETAAFVEPISCVVYGLQRLEIPIGANAIIYGMGPIGLLMLQLVRHGGASAVVAVDLKAEKLKLARTLGAQETVLADSQTDDHLHEISPLGFDVVIDCTGNPSVIEHTLVQVRDEGKVLFFGVAPTDAAIQVSPYAVYKKDLQILGTFALRYTFHQAIGLMSSGAVQTEPLLSERLPIARFPEALRLAGSGDALKVQIQPQKSRRSSCGVTFFVFHHLRAGEGNQAPSPAPPPLDGAAYLCKEASPLRESTLISSTIVHRASRSGSSAGRARDGDTAPSSTGANAG